MDTTLLKISKSYRIIREKGENQVNTPIYSMGRQADDIFASFALNDEESQDYTTVKEKFETYFVVKKQISFTKEQSSIQEFKRITNPSVNLSGICIS